MSANRDLKLTLRGLGVPVWQACDAVGWSVSKYYRLVRHEWTPEEKKQFLATVRNYIEEEHGG